MQKVLTIKEKMLDFCASGERQKINRQPIASENIVTMHIIDKRCVSRIYKECLQLNDRKTIPFKNGAGGF